MCPGGDAPPRDPRGDAQIHEANASKPADQRAAIPFRERGTGEHHRPLRCDCFCQGGMQACEPRQTIAIRERLAGAHLRAAAR
jgi:hypothetical protein